MPFQYFLKFKIPYYFIVSLNIYVNDIKSIEMFETVSDNNWLSPQIPSNNTNLV